MGERRVLWDENPIYNRQLVYFLVTIVIFLVHSIYLSFSAEDAFITFRFARHLAQGYGIVWNVGEAPVEGYTNFLWMVMCALMLRAGLDVVVLSRVVGIIASIVTMGYTYRFARSILGLAGGYAVIPCLFLAVSGPFATWASSGMETNLFCMLILMGCYYLASSFRSGSSGGFILAFVAVLLATLTRPEGFVAFSVIAALGFVCVLVYRTRFRRHS